MIFLLLCNIKITLSRIVISFQEEIIGVVDYQLGIALTRIY